MKTQPVLERIWRDLANSKRFVVAISVALALLGVFLVLQIWNDLEQSRPAQPFTLDLDQGVIFHLAYPPVLQVDPPGKAGAALTAWITGPVTSTLVCTVTLQAADGLVFTGASGESVRPRLRVEAGSASVTTPTLFLRPAPLKDGLPQTAEVQARVLSCSEMARGGPEGKFQVGIETRGEARWRFFVERVLAQIALPLSLAITLTGWILENAKKQAEQLEAERRRRIELILKLVESDPLQALHMYASLVTDEPPGRWSVILQQELAHARTRLQGKESTFVAALETAITRREWDAYEKSLAAILSLTDPGTGPRQHYQTLKATLDPLAEKCPETTLLAAAAAWLLKTHGGACREAFIYLALAAPDKGAFRRMLSNHLRNKLEDYAIVFNDPRLNKIFSDLQTKNYHLPAVTIAPAPPLDPLTGWLKQVNFALNPFPLPPLDQVPLVEKAVDSLVNLNLLVQPRAGIYRAPDPDDAVVIAKKLVATLQPETQRWGGFVTLWRPNPAHPLDRLNCLYGLGRAMASAWLDLLASNPDAWFELATRERALLAEFLTWGAGGWPQVELALLQRREPDQQSWTGRAFWQALSDLSARASQNRLEPDAGKVLRWMALRPMRVDGSYAIVILRLAVAGSPPYSPAVFLDIKPDLELARVVLKLILAPEAGATEGFPVRGLVDLCWSDGQLLQVIQARVLAATRGDKPTLSDLFAHEPFPEADRRLAEKAQGSLSTLFRIGNTVLSAHAQRYPDDADLDRDEFSDLLDQL